jgi:hypothetical protein
MVDTGCTKLQKSPYAVGAKFAWRDGGNGIGFSQDSGLLSYDPVRLGLEYRAAALVCSDDTRCVNRLQGQLRWKYFLFASELGTHPIPFP